MDDRTLVAAILTDREAYDRLSGRLSADDFSEQARFIVKCASQFYRTDTEALSVDRAVLESQIGRHFANHKHARAVLQYLDELPEEVSTKNVATEYRQLRRYNVAMDLAAELAASNFGEKTEALIHKYQELGVEQETVKPRLTLDDLQDTVGDGSRIKLVPNRLNDACGGGPVRGHSILVYGRPESGKTAMAINLAAGCLMQGLRVLYAANEEPISDVQKRFITRLGGVGIGKINQSRTYLRKAEEKALARGYDNLIAKDLTTGRITEVEALIRQYEPDVLVLDQLKNISMPGAGNKVLELDVVAREVRRLAKAYDLLAISVTQAGDSAEGKLVLQKNDVDWSNTGIPGAVDLMIGVGVNSKYDLQGVRMISLPKNKLGDGHPNFPLKFQYQYSRYSGKGKRRD